MHEKKVFFAVFERFSASLVPSADIDAFFSITVLDAVELLTKVVLLVRIDAVGTHPVLYQGGNRNTAGSRSGEFLVHVDGEQVINGRHNAELAGTGQIVELRGSLRLRVGNADGCLAGLLLLWHDTRGLLLREMTDDGIDVAATRKLYRVAKMVMAPLPNINGKLDIYKVLAHSQWLNLMQR